MRGSAKSQFVRQRRVEDAAELKACESCDIENSGDEAKVNVEHQPTREADEASVTKVCAGADDSESAEQQRWSNDNARNDNESADEHDEPVKRSRLEMCEPCDVRKQEKMGDGNERTENEESVDDTESEEVSDEADEQEESVDQETDIEPEEVSDEAVQQEESVDQKTDTGPEEVSDDAVEQEESVDQETDTEPEEVSDEAVQQEESVDQKTDTGPEEVGDEAVQQEESVDQQTDTEPEEVSDEAVEQEEFADQETDIEPEEVSDEAVEQEEFADQETDIEPEEVSDEAVEQEEFVDQQTDTEPEEVSDEAVEQEESVDQKTDTGPEEVGDEAVQQEESIDQQTDTEPEKVSDEAVEQEEFADQETDIEPEEVSDEAVEQEEFVDQQTDTEPEEVSDEAVEQEESVDQEADTELAEGDAVSKTGDKTDEEKAGPSKIQLSSEDVRDEDDDEEVNPVVMDCLNGKPVRATVELALALKEALKEALEIKVRQYVWQTDEQPEKNQLEWENELEKCIQVVEKRRRRDPKLQFNVQWPYFKAVRGKDLPEPNADTLKLAELGAADVLAAPARPWTDKDVTKLHVGVRSELRQLELWPDQQRFAAITKELEILNKKTGKPDNQKMVKKLKTQMRDLVAKINAFNVTESNVEEYLAKFGPQIDWRRIASVHMQKKRSADECRLAWKNVTGPKLLKLRPSTAELQQLQELVGSTTNPKWEEIAERLGTGRPAFACCQAYHVYVKPRKPKVRSWTNEETSRLAQVVSESTTADGVVDWERVGAVMKHYTPSDCRLRWASHLDPERKKGRWTMDEDRRLIAAVQQLGPTRWLSVAEQVPGRTAAQCRWRWLTSIDSDIKHGKWSPEEDCALMMGVKLFKPGKWSLICQLLPGRTPDATKTRYKTLTRQLTRRSRRKVRMSENEHRRLCYAATTPSAFPTAVLESKKQRIAMKHEQGANDDMKVRITLKDVDKALAQVEAKLQEAKKQLAAAPRSELDNRIAGILQDPKNQKALVAAVKRIRIAPGTKDRKEKVAAIKDYLEQHRFLPPNEASVNAYRRLSAYMANVDKAALITAVAVDEPSASADGPDAIATGEEQPVVAASIEQNAAASSSLSSSDCANGSQQLNLKDKQGCFLEQKNVTNLAWFQSNEQYIQLVENAFSAMFFWSALMERLANAPEEEGKANLESDESSVND